MSMLIQPLNLDDLESIRLQLGDSLDELKGGRLFLTGGTGFFGRWLVESFLYLNKAARLDARLTILSRDPGRFQASAPHLQSNCISFIEGDIRRFAFPEGVFTHLIHAATEANDRLNTENPLEMFDVIVSGTRRVLEYASQCGVRRLLYVSSGAVYGPQPQAVSHLDEENYYGFAPTATRNAYAEGKRAAEFLCSAFVREDVLKIPIARCFAFVGPHLPLDAHFAIGNFIKDLLHGRPIRVGGDGSPMRSYLYASDMAAWLWTILLKGESGRAYNVGSADSISIRELALKIASLEGLEVTFGSAPSPGTPIHQYVPNVNRATQELGCRVQMPLDEAISRTIAFHRQ